MRLHLLAVLGNPWSPPRELKDVARERERSEGTQDLYSLLPLSPRATKIQPYLCHHCAFAWNLYQKKTSLHVWSETNHEIAGLLVSCWISSFEVFTFKTRSKSFFPNLSFQGTSNDAHYRIINFVSSLCSAVCVFFSWFLLSVALHVRNGMFLICGWPNQCAQCLFIVPQCFSLPSPLTQTGWSRHPLSLSLTLSGIKSFPTFDKNC